MHNHVALSLNTSYVPFSSHPKTLQNPRLNPTSRGEGFGFYCHSFFKCKGFGIPVHKWRRPSYLSYGNGSVEDERIIGFGVKEIDVATLGNLCVDIVLNVPKLPPKPLDERKAYMEELSNLSPDKGKVRDSSNRNPHSLTLEVKTVLIAECSTLRYWEAGGNCNVAIAAARLGLQVVSIGHIGDEIYGRFLLDALHDEGITMVDMSEQNDVIETLHAAYETLLCWVLVDPWQRHGFCSRADFSDEPAFSWMSDLSSGAKKAIRRSKIIFCNGYGFDELSPRLLMSALDYSVKVGTSIFFDPGPRGKSLAVGTPEEQMALDKYLRMSDVLLLTSEEAESLTGSDDPILAGQELLQKGIRTKWVIIKMGSKGSILITTSSISCSPAFKVNVIDTVGCGDSFVAAIAFGYIHELPLICTLTIANAVGAATAMGCGAGRNVAKIKQVMEIAREFNLNEDDQFWEELLEEHRDAEEITLLTKMVVNGSNKWLKRASLQKAVCELLPKLELSQTKQVGACCLKSSS